MKKSYVLENVKEFERLEKQSQTQAYNYQAELSGFAPKATGVILDAGCGSGVVSRYLAQTYPQGKVIGGDYSEQRVAQAQAFIQQPGQTVPNLNFQREDLTQISLESSSVDAIVCRYVLEHMNHENAAKSVKEFYRCMRPNGKLCVIDFDGLIYNLSPLTPFLKEAFQKIQNIEGMDLNVGRHIPHWVADAGFENVQWKTETFSFQGAALLEESQRIAERFELVMPTLKNSLGNESNAFRFVEEYLSALKKPGAVLFYNKFIVTAEKRGLKIQK